jgi:hypothetical protein
MDEILDVFELDLGEMIAGGLQALLAGFLVVLGIVLMIASILVDGLFLWGVLLLVGGLVVGVIALLSFLDGVL